MSWVTVIWSMVASACLTLAAMHLLVWCKKRTAWANLLFSLTAAATAALAGCELWMMRAETPGQFGTALRWVHVPAFGADRRAGWFRADLSAGRAAVARLDDLRGAGVLADPQFPVAPNLNYREITASAAHPIPGRFRLRRRGRAESVDARRPSESAVACGLCRGRRDHRLATGRPAAGAGSGWQHRVLRAGSDSADHAGALGNCPLAAHGELLLPGHRRGDGLRDEPTRCSAPRNCRTTCARAKSG